LATKKRQKECEKRVATIVEREGQGEEVGDNSREIRVGKLVVRLKEEEGRRTQFIGPRVVCLLLLPLSLLPLELMDPQQKLKTKVAKTKTLIKKYRIATQKRLNRAGPEPGPDQLQLLVNVRPGKVSLLVLLVLLMLVLLLLTLVARLKTPTRTSICSLDRSVSSQCFEELPPDSRILHVDTQSCKLLRICDENEEEKRRK
jgi:hypothetical protein